MACVCPGDDITADNIPANFDEDYDSNGDEETSNFVNKEAEEAEKAGHDSGRPGSLLNRMISHGNKKTEDQLAREAAAANPQTSTGGAANSVVR